VVSLINSNVLVTGATGFIGRHLVERLLQEKANVWTLSRKRSKSFPEPIHQLQSNLESLTQSFWRDLRLPKFDIVYHLGGFTPKTSSSANDLDRCFADNIVGTRQLLDSIYPLPSRFIFASTLDVYAKPISGGIHEGSPIGPSTLYGSSKLFAETHIAHWADQQDVAAIILRYGHIFGPGEGAYEKFIPRAIRCFLSGNSPIVHGDGSIVRDFLYVDDAVEATVRASTATSVEGRTINIVRGEKVSIRQTVELLAELTNFTGEITYRRDLPCGRDISFDNSYMRKLLGRWQFIPIEVGLEREIAATLEPRLGVN